MGQRQRTSPVSPLLSRRGEGRTADRLSLVPSTPASHVAPAAQWREAPVACDHDRSPNERRHPAPGPRPSPIPDGPASAPSKLRIEPSGSSIRVARREANEGGAPRSSENGAWLPPRAYRSPQKLRSNNLRPSDSKDRGSPQTRSPKGIAMCRFAPPDGHPTNGLSYPPGVPGFTTTHAIFVGSVDVTNIPTSSCGGNGGGGYGTSVIPFYRNGSQVIYDTNTTCMYTYSLDAGPGPSGTCGNEQAAWDLGIPSGPIRGEKEIAPDPGVFGFDFTADGLSNVFPLSASKVILDVEGHSDSGGISTTLCFLDPSNPTISAAMRRTCQSELMMDAVTNGGNNFVPYFPFRTSLNLGLGSSGYGEFWVGGATWVMSTMGSQTYFDLSYRGYVEPERQLVPQATIPLGR